MSSSQETLLSALCDSWVRLKMEESDHKSECCNFPVMHSQTPEEFHNARKLSGKTSSSITRLSNLKRQPYLDKTDGTIALCILNLGTAGEWRNAKVCLFIKMLLVYYYLFSLYLLCSSLYILIITRVVSGSGFLKSGSGSGLVGHD